MSKQTLLWVINISLFILGIAVAYQAWQAWQHTTVLVEWTTASELDTIGFNLYRSEKSNDRGSLVNQEMIPSSSDPLTGGSYEFEDRNVRAGVKYYYSLEEVENSGLTNHAGTIEVTATRSGWWEIGLAALLFGSALVGVINLTGSYRKKRRGS